MDYAQAKLVFEALEREGVRYVVFGGVALNFHGLARFTEDLDSVADLLGEYPAIQYIPPSGTFHIDLLTRLGEAFAFKDLEVVRMPFEGVTVSVVSPRTLYRMKRDTVRLKDRADAEMLRERFQLEDE